MSIFTVNTFEKISQKRAGLKTFSAIKNQAKLESRASNTTSIFLSHAHSDKDILEESLAFFKGFNISIYVDWADETMPEHTSGLTATNIKTKIISNDKFILLATNEAILSKWCNWELGIGDTFKASKDKLVILPLADSKGHWTGNEYLQIYPRIETVPPHDTIFKIIYPDGSTKWLDDWLKL